ncbi:MAG: TetR/AcrR family transcriptional regulator [Beijerinckiaceae bacterium]|nr:TetR/AcrR family transcriptional regulator [Beijerinckiaceae bacterium]
MRGLTEIKAKVTGLQTHLGEAPVLLDTHTSPDDRRGSEVMRTEKESKGRDTHRLIIEVAEKLFRQLGFQKTTVADIARELSMSPANVYRFFAAKSEINAAVCRDILAKTEAEAEKIAMTRGSAAQRLQNLLASVERTHHKRYMFDRKLHELVEAAITESWAIMGEHNQRMAAILEQIIAYGMAAGEFRQGDAAVAARLVNTACIRFCHPRLMVEYDKRPEPTLDQMIGFCLAALSGKSA